MRILLASTDLFAPAIALTSPAAGTVSGTITISANASDNYSVVGVQFKMDGVNIGAEDTVAPYSVNYDTHLLANGGHTISAVARDAAGNTKTATVNITVSNGIAAGDLVFGEFEYWDDGDQTYYGGRQHIPTYEGRWDENWIWGNFGDKSSHPIPGNPDPTHYQMQLQFGIMPGGGIEGGSDGNHVHVYMWLDGTEYDVWDNGPGGGGFQTGPLFNVNGGNGVGFNTWQSIPDWNTSIRRGIAAHYSYVPKAGYLS